MASAVESIRPFWGLPIPLRVIFGLLDDIGGRAYVNFGKGELHTLQFLVFNI